MDDSDNARAKEAAMPGPPYESIFAKEDIFGKRVHFAGRVNPCCFCFTEATA